MKKSSRRLTILSTLSAGLVVISLVVGHAGLTTVGLVVIAVCMFSAALIESNSDLKNRVDFTP